MGGGIFPTAAVKVPDWPQPCTIAQINTFYILYVIYMVIG